ncbi:16S rRNA (guanine(966)-N(2))-methyltransferase RsmD [Candidatus Saccharibacteria bacterium]|nr:16S rRNA (guanine(966)-N(2))-methyltransferase RsmD [Candidatus Saccharibacteria bacterium]
MENIRITSGIYRGQSLKSPKSSLTHPMGSREKLALFNMIADKLPGAEVLDVFAGSGALGIEALSRGAASAIFVEKSPKIAQIIKENLKKLSLNSKIITSSVENYTTDQKFDLILADPPYDNFKKDTIAHLTKYLKNDGILVLSHPTPAPVIDGLKLTKTRKYAKANISFYQR